MSKQKRQRSAKIKRGNSIQPKSTAVVREEQFAAHVNAENGLDATIASKNAVPLGNNSISLIHRQALAAEMGEHNGNRYLRRALYASIGDNDKKQGSMSASFEVPQRIERHLQSIQRDLGDNQFRLREPDKLSIREAEAPSLDIGELQLDPSLLEGLPIQSAFPANLALHPSQAMLYELVNQWADQYRLLHPGPAPAQNVWQQVTTAWNALAQQALISNPSMFADPAAAQRELQEQAIERLSKILAGQAAEEPVNVSAVLAEIASPVGEALSKAFQKTDFFTKLKENATKFGEENWPALIPLLTGPLSAMIGQAVSQGDWRNVSLVTNQLLPKLSESLAPSINLSNDWKIRFQLQPSESIVGAIEHGVVIGAQPAITLTYKDIEFFGSVNMRFEIGPDGMKGLQLHAVSNVGLTFPW